MPNEFYLKTGDTAPDIEVILSDANGPVNLTGATVQFRMSPDGGGNPLIEAAAVIVNAAAGHVKYVWQTGDTTLIATHKCEWRVTYSTGKIATFPRGGTDLFNLVIIQDKVT